MRLDEMRKGKDYGSLLAEVQALLLEFKIKIAVPALLACIAYLNYRTSDLC